MHASCHAPPITLVRLPCWSDAPVCVCAVTTNSAANQWCTLSFWGQRDEHMRLILEVYLSFILACWRCGGEESLKGPADRRQSALVCGQDMATHVKAEVTFDGRARPHVQLKCHVTWACVVDGRLLFLRGCHRAVTFFLYLSSLWKQHGW